jgi:hypothetical protein
MKKLMSAAVALALLTGTVAIAQMEPPKQEKANKKKTAKQKAPKKKAEQPKAQ